MRQGDLLAPVPPRDEELTEVLACGEGARVERILSWGQASPEGFWYDQEEWEWVAVLQGSAELEFPESRRALKPGDWVLIPPHRRHRVVWTSSEPPCVWLAVFGLDLSSAPLDGGVWNE